MDQDFGDNLVNDVTQAGRSKFFVSGGMANFWNPSELVACKTS
jgi:hypothetical protein